MACKIISQREWKEEPYYEVIYWNYANGGGFGFPCDEHGNIDENMNDAAKSNYEYAKAHPEKFDVNGKVGKFKNRYVEPAHAICECGEEILLQDEYLGACECPECGRWHNMFGQEVNPPETWREGDDW